MRRRRWPAAARNGYAGGTTHLAGPPVVDLSTRPVLPGRSAQVHVWPIVRVVLQEWACICILPVCEAVGGVGTAGCLGSVRIVGALGGDDWVGGCVGCIGCICLS
jgi:hypothetical protein